MKDQHSKKTKLSADLIRSSPKRKLISPLWSMTTVIYSSLLTRSCGRQRLFAAPITCCKNKTKISLMSSLTLSEKPNPKRVSCLQRLKKLVRKQIRRWPNRLANVKIRSKRYRSSTRERQLKLKINTRSKSQNQSVNLKAFKRSTTIRLANSQHELAIWKPRHDCRKKCCEGKVNRKMRFS